MLQFFTFEWDADKAQTNSVKHGVSFEEAVSTFRDPFSSTITDPLHSEDEERFVLTGTSVLVHQLLGGFLSFHIPTEATRYELSAHGQHQNKKENNMKMTNEEILSETDDMLPEYDFRGGVRGKYVSRFTDAAPVVVEIAPDVAAVFPDTKAVNEALRTLLRAVRSAPPIKSEAA